MSIDRLRKQPYEAFRVTVNFTENMELTETILSNTIAVVDKDGTDVTSTLLDISLSAIEDHNVHYYVQAGSRAASPYKVTTRILTSESNKWEHDLQLTVSDR